MSEIVISTLEQGLIFAIVAIGVYITYKILDFPDLSVDGTFPLGAAVCAFGIMRDINPFLCCFLAFLAGCIAGFFTGILNVKLKIDALMSGILVMTGLYSINLRIMGKSNVPFFSRNLIFSEDGNKIFIIIVILAIVKILFDLFLKTKQGFLLTAVGDNEQMVTSLGVNKDNVKVLGLMISNGLVALGGSLTAQYQGYAEVSMGTGVVVMGLAAVIIGSTILGKISFIKGTTLAIIGAIVYKTAMAVALQFRIEPQDLKLITTIIIVIALSCNGKLFSFKKKVKGGEAVVTN